MQAGHEDLTAQELRDVQSFVAVGNFAAAKHILLRTRGRTELYNMPVEYMALTKRATKALKNAGYITIGMLAGCAMCNIFPLVGNEVDTIRSWMAEHGLRLGTPWGDLDHKSEKALRDREFEERTRVRPGKGLDGLFRLAELTGEPVVFGDDVA